MMDDETESYIKSLIPRIQINEGGKLLKGWSRFIFDYGKSGISVIDDTNPLIFERTDEDLEWGVDYFRCACGELARKSFAVARRARTGASRSRWGIRADWWPTTAEKAYGWPTTG